MMTLPAGQVSPVATNERYMAVPPEAVWAVLADPGGYGYWVVGSKVDPRRRAGVARARGRSSTTPSASARSTISDHTESLEADPPRLLKLRAKGRPLGTATVTLELEPRATAARSCA